MCAWLLGPLVWAVVFRRRPGLRSRERAMGVVIGHATNVMLMAMILGGAAVFGRG
jgi:hypothetical protein